MAKTSHLLKTSSTIPLISTKRILISHLNSLEITKQSSSTCNISIFYPLTFNTDERRGGIPLIDLTSPYLYACPKIVPGFPTKYGIFVFSELANLSFVKVQENL
jgi:hypothetical protein